MKLHKDIKRIVLNVAEIKKATKKLANKINNEYKERRPIIIGILKGCIPFYNEVFLNISSAIDPIMDFMIVSSYDGTQSSNIKIVADLRQNIKDKDVIILEDIVDTGRTLLKVKELLLLRQPRSLKFFCLVDKPSCRVVSFEPDYSCFKIKPVFIVGWGFDYNEHYRCLPYVGELKSSIYKQI